MVSLAKALAKPKIPLAALPRSTRTLEICPRCRLRDCLSREVYAWDKMIPFVGYVEQHTPLCGICRVELHRRTYTAGA
jgi:hypothetical protein